ncbi:NADPH-dependent diflavin oxidoreductase 1 [Cloeon dipterum]|uniref:NADPH-dependent diflavin oxidoreductase 1 n=1 Tax=Cloeon dipterum TaxID=197152 RepID=UPI003220A0B1
MGVGSEERNLLILFGSQTGTAQEVAEQIWREAKRHGWEGCVRGMDEVEPVALLRQEACVFVCSTTGQGQEPDNMRSLWRFLLHRALPQGSLQNMSFGVLGLGDSSYAKFNFVAKRLQRRLMQLGATPLLAAGLADDQHQLGPDAVVGPWTTDLWSKLDEAFPLPQGGRGQETEEGKVPEVVPMRYKVRIGRKGDRAVRGREIPSDQVLVATLEERVRTTSADHDQEVNLVRVRASGLSYSPGDVLMVQPLNPDDKVERLLRLFRLEPDDTIELLETDERHPIPLPPSWMCPNPCPAAEVVAKLLDLQAVPQRYALTLMAHFTTSELEEERLLELASPQGQEDLFSYCHRPRRSTLEVLEDFPHAAAALPPEFLFDIFRLIRPRAFSIASAPQTYPECAELLVAVVKYRTILSSPRLGLCSNWLARLPIGAPLHVWVKPGSFTFPKDQTIPVICVGPGTGCAPFLSLAQQRASYPEPRAEMVMFFGCRKEKGDFHCEQQWRRLAAEGVIRLFCAFSQDQPDKVYVQHKIEEQAALLWRLLALEGAFFYVAGNAKNMPKGVRDAVLQVAQSQGGLDVTAAETFVSGLEKGGRYQTETWA